MRLTQDDIVTRRDYHMMIFSHGDIVKWWYHCGWGDCHMVLKLHDKIANNDIVT